MQQITAKSVVNIEKWALLSVIYYYLPEFCCNLALFGLLISCPRRRQASDQLIVDNTMCYRRGFAQLAEEATSFRSAGPMF